MLSSCACFLPFSEIFDSRGYCLKNVHETFLRNLRALVGKTLTEAEEKWILYILLKVAYPAHAGQFRDEGPPYIIHPLEVALEALNHGEAAEVICVALLHDTLEDTYLRTMSRRQLRKKFHSKILEWHTELLSKVVGDRKLSFQTYLANLGKDPVVVRVKCYDRMVNLRSFGRMVRIQAHRVKRQIKETREHIIPLVRGFDEALCQELVTITDQLEIRLNFASHQVS